MWKRAILPALKRKFPGQRSFVVQQDGDPSQNDALARRPPSWLLSLHSVESLH